MYLTTTYQVIKKVFHHNRFFPLIEFNNLSNITFENLNIIHFYAQQSLLFGTAITKIIISIKCLEFEMTN